MRLEPWILRPKVYSSLEGILEMDLSEHLAPKCARNSPLSQKAHLQHVAEIRQTFKAPWDLLIFWFLGGLEYRRVAFRTASFCKLSSLRQLLLTNQTPHRLRIQWKSSSRTRRAIFTENSWQHTYFVLASSCFHWKRKFPACCSDAKTCVLGFPNLWFFSPRLELNFKTGGLLSDLGDDEMMSQYPCNLA